MKKLKLNELKIQSFVTSTLQEGAEKTLRGGTGNAIADQIKPFPTGFNPTDPQGKQSISLAPDTIINSCSCTSVTSCLSIPLYCGTLNPE